MISTTNQKKTPECQLWGFRFVSSRTYYLSLLIYIIATMYGECQGASEARRRRATLDTHQQPRHSPCKGAVKDCFPLPNGECPRSGNGSRDKSLVGVKGQTAPALGERRDCHYLDFDIKKRASFLKKSKKPSKYKGFVVFACTDISYHLY